VFFTSGGSDSIETAAKLARHYWVELGQPQKTFLISRSGAYHGLHAYGTSLAGIPANREGFGELVSDTALVHDRPRTARAHRLYLRRGGGSGRPLVA